MGKSTKTSNQAVTGIKSTSTTAVTNANGTTQGKYGTKVTGAVYRNTDGIAPSSSSTGSTGYSPVSSGSGSGYSSGYSSGSGSGITYQADGSPSIFSNEFTGTGYTASNSSSYAGTPVSSGTTTVGGYGAGNYTPSYTTPEAPTQQSANFDVAAAAEAATPDYSLNYQTDAAGQAYIDAMAKIAQDLGEKPTYDTTYDQKLEDAYNNIVNRDPFNWNASEDEFYQDYAKRYTQLGQKAMEDTMGQAAALTGGYGNTYAQRAGQDAYSEWMDALMEKSVELEQRAYDRYMDAGQELYNQFSLLSNLQQNAYGQYRDAVSDYNYNLSLLQAYEADNYARAQYNNNLKIEAEQTGYNRAQDQLAQLQYQDSYNYQLWRDQVDDMRYQDELNYSRYRDSVSDQRYAEETSYNRYRDTVADSQFTDEMNYKYTALNNSGSSSSSSSGSSGRSSGGSSSSVSDLSSWAANTYAANDYYAYKDDNGNLQYRSSVDDANSLGLGKNVFYATIADQAAQQYLEDSYLYDGLVKIVR